MTGKESVCACVHVCVGVCVSVCVSSAAVFLLQTCWLHKCTSHFVPIRQTEIKIDTVGQPELQSVRFSRCKALHLVQIYMVLVPVQNMLC